LQRGFKLNPHDPQNWIWLNFLALAQLFAGSPEDALLSATRASGSRPDWRPLLETVACCYAAADKSDDASRCVERMSRLPVTNFAGLAPLWEGNPQWRDDVDKLLRRAGWKQHRGD
jgi:hypothetical protein